MRRQAGEGTIIQRKDGRFEARITIGRTPEGKQVYRSFYGKTAEEVAAKLDEARQRRAGGIVLTGKRHTVAKHLRAWLATLETKVDGGELEVSTFRRYRQIVENNLIPLIGSIALTELTPTHVEQMYGEARAKGLSQRTVSHLRAVLRTSLRQAERDGHIARNVASLASPPKVRRTHRPVLTGDQVDRLLSGSKDEPLHALWRLTVLTGMRQGELLGLRWQDVDLEGASLRIEHALKRDRAGCLTLGQTKTEQSRRHIGLGAGTVAVLRAHKARQNEDRLRVGDAWHDEDYVFARPNGQPLYGTLVHRKWVALSERLGLPKIAFHDLRHTAASHMLAGGIDLALVSEQLGHSTIRLTRDTYIHVMPDQMRQVADRMEVRFGGGAG